MLFAAAVGIMLDRWLEVPIGIWLALLAVALLASWICRSKSGMRRRLASLSLAVAVLCLGGGWHHVHWFLFPSNDLASFSQNAPQPAAVRGIIASLPEVRPAPAFDPLQLAAAEERTQFDLQATEIRVGGLWQPASGLCSVMVEGRLAEFLPGDRIQVFGQLSRQQPAGNPGEFDFAADHRAEGRLTALRAPQPEGVTLLDNGDEFNYRRGIAKIRRSCRNSIDKYLPRELAGFAAALLIGERQDLGTSRRDAFLMTNSMHFLAISGLHIGILAAGLFALLRLGWVPRRWALGSVVIVTFAYLIISGAQPPAVRSFILAAVVCGGLLLNRSWVGLNSLALAGLFVLAVNPNDLFRVGPQLSFLAVLTLMTVAPYCARLGTIRDPLLQLIHQNSPWPRRAIRWLAVIYLRGALISLCVWLVTLPLVAARFHLLSPVASPLSPIIWPLIAIALFSGFGVLAFGSWLPPVAICFAWVAQQMLNIIDWCVDTAAGIRGSHAWVSGPDDWWLVGFYLLVCGLMIFRPRRRMLIATTAVLVVWLSVGAIDGLTLNERPVGTLRCTVLSMRHGCCVVLELPDQQVLVYDAGRLGSPRGAVQSISAFLWARGIGKIDHLVVSHDDADHFNAVPGLIKRDFGIAQVHTPPRMLDGELSAATAALRDAIQDSRVSTSQVHRGQVLMQSLNEEHPYRVAVLHPPETAFDGSDNSQSIVLLIEYAGRTILLPGDLEPPGLEMVLATEPIDSDFLLAPHHGSRSSDPPGFAAWCQPDLTVISGGRNFAVDDVTEDYRRAGSKVFHTAEHGAVTYTIDANGEASFTTHLQGN